MFDLVFNRALSSDDGSNTLVDKNVTSIMSTFNRSPGLAPLTKTVQWQGLIARDQYDPRHHY